MSSNPPVYQQPDIEAFVIRELSDLGVTIWLVASQMDYPNWQMRHTIQVDARVGDRKDAAANLARTAMYRILSLPGVDWPEGVLTYVQPTMAPQFQPDPDGKAKYIAQYELRAHPRNPSLVAPLATHKRR